MKGEWKLRMEADPIIKPWTQEGACQTNGAELQRLIILGFGSKGDPVWSSEHKAFVFEHTFTFREHGEFFRGALTMASLRYSNDFYEYLKRYETVKVIITKFQEVEPERTEVSK